MAIKNKIITNPKTGQKIKFLQTEKDTHGKMLELESTFTPHSKEPMPHYHPKQVEDFVVLKGEMNVRIDGEVRVLKENESLQIPANKIHSMWNASENITTVNWKTQPALKTEYFLETAFGLAADGKTNEASTPGILQAVLLLNNFTDTYRLASPPFLLQKILFTLLTPIALLCGFRATYQKYID